MPWTLMPTRLTSFTEMPFIGALPFRIGGGDQRHPAARRHGLREEGFSGARRAVHHNPPVHVIPGDVPGPVGGDIGRQGFAPGLCRPEAVQLLQKRPCGRPGGFLWGFLFIIQPGFRTQEILYNSRIPAPLFSIQRMNPRPRTPASSRRRRSLAHSVIAVPPRLPRAAPHAGGTLARPGFR